MILGNIEFCSKTHVYSNLSFTQGDAIQLLMFEDSSCDAVFNVESSHSYHSISKFINEVTRILRPGGHLCFVDSRHKVNYRSLNNIYRMKFK